MAFSAEMTAVPGTMRMAMRIDLEERAPDEVEFHTVTAPGLGVWRSSDPKVKVYKYLKQVTNLSAPAFYRGLRALPLAERQGPHDQAGRAADEQVRAAGRPAGTQRTRRRIRHGDELARHDAGCLSRAAVEREPPLCRAGADR